MLSPLVGCIAGLALAAGVLARNPGGRAHRAFAGFAATLAVWCVAVYQFRAAPDADAAQRWQLLVYATLFVSPALFYHLAHAVAGLPDRADAVVVYVVSLAALLAAATRFDLVVRGVTHTPAGWVPLGGPLAALWFFVAVLITLLTFVPLGRGLRRAPRRRPLALLAVATVIRLLAPLVVFGSVLLAARGVITRPPPPIAVETSLLVAALAAVATLDTGS
ncbi:MAG TPA: hypothetical protein VFL90_04315 [Methylomirabilota bacterium]|nr:hypothetical protein [Methylomirabilota bacterium]